MKARPIQPYIQVKEASDPQSVGVLPVTIDELKEQLELQQQMIRSLIRFANRTRIKLQRMIESEGSFCSGQARPVEEIR